MRLLKIYRGPKDPVTMEQVHESLCDMMTAAVDKCVQTKPTWLIATENELYVLVDDFFDNVSKNSAVFIISCILKALDAKSYSFGSEAYVAQVSQDKKDVLPSELSASERDECLMVYSFTKTGEHLTTRWLIHKDRSLGPRIDDDVKGSGMSGRMWNNFKYFERENEPDPVQNAG